MKIMLLSFALLAIVGGALAFKAKSLPFYCTAAVESNGTCLISGAQKACPNHILYTTAAGSTRFTYCYTTPVATRNDCKNAAGTADLLCTTPTTSFITTEQ